MPIYKPTELHQFLSGLGIAPKKGLSQNFLIDGNIIRKIVSAAGVKKGDTVLEIGPGPGSLSECLLDAGVHLIAVEKDLILAEALARLKNSERNLEIFCEDIMKFPIAERLSPIIAGGKAKAIANLPYHLTTPIIIYLIQQKTIFSSLVVMVQEEVARRFVAKPGTSEYSSFTLFLNFHTKPRYAFTVSKNCFYPAPSVESAVVILELREPPYVSNEIKFFEMTRRSFEHRRKMLRGSLRDLYAPAAIMQALTKIGKTPQARPEELSLEEFINLFELLQIQL
jgi:16S rRNA (adenine1518-N6/adenine1519-N6)-dimethyltransferase